MYREGGRNYFTFDLSSSCKAASVSLRVTKGTGPTGPPDPAGILTILDPASRYTMYQVTTPAAIVNNPSGPPPYDDWFPNSLRVFDDLGDGTQYGSYVYPFDGAASNVLAFPLNAAGVADYNSARGGFFTIGGSGGGPSYLTSNYFESREAIFDGTSDPAQLAVTCALPTQQDECRNGGWREFGAFTNQGGCVSYVATRRTRT